MELRTYQMGEYNTPPMNVVEYTLIATSKSDTFMFCVRGFTDLNGNPITGKVILSGEGSYATVLNGDVHVFDDLPSLCYVGVAGNRRLYWRHRDRRHRDGDKPAEVAYKAGKIEYELYCKDDLYHRDVDKPAKIEYDSDGNVAREQYFKNGDRHRDGDNPALLIYEAGKLKHEMYYKHGCCHRDGDKPATIEYGDDGNVVCEVYYKKGYVHRDNDRPASINQRTGQYTWAVNGVYGNRLTGPSEITATGMTVWKYQQKRHRFGGPAVTTRTGKEAWYWFGVKVTEEQYSELMNEFRKVINNI